MQNNWDDDFQELTRRDYLELCFLLLIVVPSILFEVKMDGLGVAEPRLGVIKVIVGLFAFGLVHIVSSHALSYLYNLNRLILPSFLRNIYPVLTAKQLQIGGSVFIIISVIFVILHWEEISILAG